MRAFVTGTITFGLVSIPVKFYVSASDEGIKFNLLTKAGNRIRQKVVDSVTGEDVEQKDLDKGYEFAKGQFVRFTAAEIEALQLKTTRTIDITEFVDPDTIDFIHIEKTYYLGPDKGGDKGYTLLADTMVAKNKVAVAKWTNKGRQHLVVVRPYKKGLVLQVLYYGHEVRDFSQIEVATIPISDAEKNMAAKLLDTLVSEEGFDPGKYRDEFRDILQEAIEKKVAGKEISFAESAPDVPVLDMLEALKNSLAPAKAEKAKKASKRVKKS